MSLHGQTIMSTDVQTPFLGTPLVPLKCVDVSVAHPRVRARGVGQVRTLLPSGQTMNSEKQITIALSLSLYIYIYADNII